MKTNGLSMGSYWTVTFLFNFALSVITFTVFYIFGRGVLKLSYFTETSPVLMAVIMVGWGLSQVSLANFVQVFISKAKSATVIGYVMAIFLTLVGEALAVGVFAMPLSVPLCTTVFTKIFDCTLECHYADYSTGWRSLAPTEAASKHSMRSTGRWSRVSSCYTEAQYCFHCPSISTKLCSSSTE
jgi:hypothetical protein